MTFPKLELRPFLLKEGILSGNIEFDSNALLFWVIDLKYDLFIKLKSFRLELWAQSEMIFI